MDALKSSLRRMVYPFTKGSTVFRRYRVAMFAYCDIPEDLLDGVLDIGKVVDEAVPILEPLRKHRHGASVRGGREAPAS